jgi:hypothetical protein
MQVSFLLNAHKKGIFMSKLHSKAHHQAADHAQLKRDVFNAFVDLAKILQSYLAHENTIMMHKGELSYETIQGYKANLIDHFNDFLDEIDTDDMTDDVLSLVKNLKKDIKLNIALQQAQFLQHSTTIGALKSKLLNSAMGDSDKWH